MPESRLEIIRNNNKRIQEIIDKIVELRKSNHIYVVGDDSTNDNIALSVLRLQQKVHMAIYEAEYGEKPQGKEDVIFQDKGTSGGTNGTKFSLKTQVAQEKNNELLRDDEHNGKNPIKRSQDRNKDLKKYDGSLIDWVDSFIDYKDYDFIDLEIMLSVLAHEDKHTYGVVGGNDFIKEGITEQSTREDADKYGLYMYPSSHTIEANFIRNLELVVRKDVIMRAGLYSGHKEFEKDSEEYKKANNQTRYEELINEIDKKIGIKGYGERLLKTLDVLYSIQNSRIHKKQPYFYRHLYSKSWETLVGKTEEKLDEELDKDSRAHISKEEYELLLKTAGAHSFSELIEPITQYIERNYDGVEEQESYRQENIASKIPNDEELKKITDVQEDVIRKLEQQLQIQQEQVAIRNADVKDCELDNPDSCYHLTRAVHEDTITENGLVPDIGIRSKDGVGNEKTKKIFFAKSLEGTLIFLNRNFNAFYSAAKHNDFGGIKKALEDDSPELYEKMFNDMVHDNMSKEELTEATLSLGKMYLERGIYYKLDLKECTREEFDNMGESDKSKIDYFSDDINEEKSDENTIVPMTINNMHTRTGRGVMPSQMTLMTTDGKKSALDIAVSMSEFYKTLHPGEPLPVLIKDSGKKDKPFLEMLVERIKEKNKTKYQLADRKKYVTGRRLGTQVVEDMQNVEDVDKVNAEMTKESREIVQTKENQSLGEE